MATKTKCCVWKYHDIKLMKKYLVTSMVTILIIKDNCNMHTIAVPNQNGLTNLTEILNLQLHFWYAPRMCGFRILIGYQAIMGSAHVHFWCGDPSNEMTLNFEK